MADRHVLLLSMPWEQLEYPSIQLGILLSVLERAGIPARARSLNLDFMEHCATATAGRAESERLSVRSYHEVVVWSRDVSIGDWIFAAAPPPSHDPDADDPYPSYLRAAGMTEHTISSALRFRALVPSFLERVADEIAASHPAIVGFTTAFNQTLASLALAGHIRARLGDRVRIVFGGANCEGEMGAALHRAFPIIDVVVRGEGERVLPDIARELLVDGAVRPHPGLCYRDPADSSRQVVVAEQPGSVSMDDLPTPTYDEYFERLERASFGAELHSEVTLFYESARGCWWGEKSHCAFCGISDLSMSFRTKSPERIVEELGDLAQRYGRLDFLFVDYILHRRYFEELLPRLRDAGFDFKIFCETKANLRRDQVRLLPEAGFTVIQAGVESLSTPILRLMRKGVTALQNLRLLKWCAEYGVRLYWNVLYGIPDEPSEEYTAMADLVPSLTHLEPPRLVPLQLDRFSPYFEHPTESGIVPLGPRRDFRFLYPTDQVDDATLAELAYAFEFRRADGREPETYTASFQRAIRAWQANGRQAIGTLRYRRGPGFLVVTDRRPGLDPAEYQLVGPEAQIYLACEDGATAEQAWTAVRGSDERAQPSVEEVGEFLDELVAARLACKVDGRYLSLALPPTPREAPEPVRRLEPAGVPRQRPQPRAPSRRRGSAMRPKEPEDAREELWALLAGRPLMHAIAVAAQLEIPDLLAESPRTAAALAQATGSHTDALYRLLRALSSAGVFAERPKRTFALTPISQLLRDDVAGSMRSVAVLAGEPWRAAWYDLPYAVRTGRPAFDHRYGTSFYECLAEDRGAAHRFDEVMRHTWESLRDEVVPAYDFSGASKIVDVGGGSGALIEAILATSQDSTGAILESPVIADEARRRIRDAGLGRRCRVVAGDLLRAVPDGGDIYLLAFVIHNWGDDPAVQILRNCQRAMTTGGRVLIIESIVPTQPGRSLAKIHDLEMLVFMPGGRERTRPEYSTLFQSAGLELTDVIPTRTSASLMVTAAT